MTSSSSHAAGGLAGALATLLVYLLGLAGVNLTPAAAGAIVAAATTLALFIRTRRRAKARLTPGPNGSTPPT